MKVEIHSKFFGNNQVLGRISLAIGKGEVIALTGPSGIGKSTLVRIFSGLDTQYAGQIAGAGKVGFVFQEPTLLPWRNLMDNIMLVTGCDAQAAKTALDQVELGERSAGYPNQMSLGQQRRVGLARALAANPQTLVLDEAFASLDEATAARMRELTQRVLDANAFSTILVTHNLEEACELADRVLVLDGAPATIVLDHHIKVNRSVRNCQTESERLRSRLNNSTSA